MPKRYPSNFSLFVDLFVTSLSNDGGKQRFRIVTAETRESAFSHASSKDSEFGEYTNSENVRQQLFLTKIDES